MFMNAVGFRFTSGRVAPLALIALFALGAGVAGAQGKSPAAASPPAAASDLEYGPQQPPTTGSARKQAGTKKARKSKKAADSKKGGKNTKAPESKKAVAPKPVAPAKKPATSSKSSAGRSTTPAKPKAPVGGIQLAPIAAAGDAVIGNRTMINCRLQSALPKEVASSNPKVVLADRPSGKILSLKIVEVDARSGGLLSGSKAMKIEGRLTDKGKIVGTFTARQKSRGSLTSCGILEKAIDEVAAEIGAWLDKPGMNSTLGNDR